MASEVELARFVYDTQYKDLPPEVILATKQDILDTIGVGLGGASSNGIGQVVDYAREMGGKESSTIWTYGLKVPPTTAALVNSSMCHARDYDDTHDKAVIHTGCVVVPAAFAVAEYTGRVSGKDLINAIALGIDVHCRLGLATKLGIGWMLPALYGYFGAATVAAKLLGLDENGILNSWGIAYSQAAGNLEMVVDGALTKRLQAGFAASSGVFAGLLAKRGITGSRKSFEGRAGMFNLYQRGQYDIAALTDELGKRFEATNLSFKPYPCCRANHSGIDAALEIAQKHDIKPEEIEEVRVGLSAYCSFAVCEPIEVKRKPRNVVDAQFSLPYSVACALVRKKADLSDYTEEMTRDPVVLSIASRVSPYIDPEIDKEAGRSISPALVEVRTKGGKVYSVKASLAKGHPQNPMTAEEFEAKFRSCASWSGRDLSSQVVDKLIDALNNLEELDDVTRMMDYLNCKC